MPVTRAGAMTEQGRGPGEGQGCWKSGLVQIRSRLYFLTKRMYCWAGGVCHRPANHRPTQPHASPARYLPTWVTVFSQAS